MGKTENPGRGGGRAVVLTLAMLAVLAAPPLYGQQRAAPAAVQTPPLAAALPEDRPLPITLPAALKLANARPLDIALAAQRVEAAQAQLDQAHALWLPSISLGVNYARHDGKIQDIRGEIINTGRSSFMAGAGPNMVFALSDAIFAPLAARQVLAARHAEVQAAANDSLLAVAEAYFNVQQARGEAAGAADAARRADDVVRRTRSLAEGLAPAVEVNRAEAELARRLQAAEAARERWETASAELARILRLPPSALVVPQEPPHLRVELVDARVCVDDLIPVALSSRPELARDQALVQATLASLRQAKLRPLVPSLLIRGNATNPSGTLSSGYFGGGINDDMTNFGARNSIDVQVLWELRNLGFGDRAAVRGRQAESQAATLELFRTQDRVAAEVVRAHAQSLRAANRVVQAERGVVNARETAEKNVIGLGQTRRVGEVLTLVFRPQEVVASIAALDQAYRDYYAAVADANRAQFRLYRALGHPAQALDIGQPHPAAAPHHAPRAGDAGVSPPPGRLP